MIEGKDIRELTRAIRELSKITNALNNTLVAIEQQRVKEKPVMYCRECNVSMCTPNALMPDDDDCICCQSNHDPSEFLSKLKHI
jgi:hypothetical protein